MPLRNSVTGARRARRVPFRAMLLLLLAWPPAWAAENEGTLLKTAYIYNVAKFTEWPERSHGPVSAPMRFCLVGEDAQVPSLWRLDGRTVKGRHLKVLTPRGGRMADECDLLYVAASEREHLVELLRTLRQQPVLTVSELDGFAQAGGMVELSPQGKLLRFTIHLGAVRAAELEISPRLLSLARVIGQD